MPRIALACLLVTLGCSEVAPGFTAADRDAVEALEERYRAAWLANDSAAVMRTLADDAVLLPGGSLPLTDEAAIRDYWWPADGSRTTIESYSITIDEIEGSGDLAVLRGRGSLTFVYVTPAGEESRLASESIHLSVARRTEGGEWRIAQRAWSSLR